MSRVLLSICCLIATTTVAAQDEARDLNELYADVRAFMAQERDFAIVEGLGLSSRESREFMPIYEAYRAEIEIVQERYAELLRYFVDNMDDLSEDAATRVLNDYFALEAAMLATRQLYISQFLEVIPPSKLVLLFQMENKIDAAAELPMVLEVPLIGEE